ncbi:hypothetical protein LC605_07275 [Nostoc sp. CHAB 5836]|uniref:hypothetical protein n=1 Tax=Nostoc sp. CHAB 5836 TaxID=2780404 RepID=UPI001E50DB60|nr:hypothetical protein [Nostoc sp. CHAB 5836]MCC5614876.1 hypothetical protein [Nostoc sp. CHAB 5836]
MDYSVLVIFVDGYGHRNEHTSLQKGRSLKERIVLIESASSIPTHIFYHLAKFPLGMICTSEVPSVGVKAMSFLSSPPQNEF